MHNIRLETELTSMLFYMQHYNALSRSVKIWVMIYCWDLYSLVFFDYIDIKHQSIIVIILLVVRIKCLNTNVVVGDYLFIS